MQIAVAWPAKVLLLNVLQTEVRYLQFCFVHVASYGYLLVFAMDSIVMFELLHAEVSGHF